MMLKYKYDTQLLIEGDGLNEYEINNYLINNFKGDCLLTVGDKNLIKVHYNTK